MHKDKIQEINEEITRFISQIDGDLYLIKYSIFTANIRLQLMASDLYEYAYFDDTSIAVIRSKYAALANAIETAYKDTKKLCDSSVEDLCEWTILDSSNSLFKVDTLFKKLFEWLCDLHTNPNIKIHNEAGFDAVIENLTDNIEIQQGYIEKDFMDKLEEILRLRREVIYG